MAETNGGGGQDFVTQIEAIRRELRTVQAEAARVVSAPVTRDEALARVDEVVARLTARWQPTIAASSLRAANFNAERVANGMFPTLDDNFLFPAALAAVAADGLVALLRATVERSYEGVDESACVPLADRPEKLQAFAARIREIEVAEETLILRAERGGVTVDRREDVSLDVLFGTHLEESA